MTATPTAGSVLQFVPDSRYTVGAFTSTVFTDPTNSHHAWQMPFLGWAVTVTQHGDDGSYDAQIRPVFLQEDGVRAVTEHDVVDTLRGVLVRLVPTEPSGLR